MPFSRWRLDFNLGVDANSKCGTLSLMEWMGIKGKAPSRFFKCTLALWIGNPIEFQVFIIPFGWLLFFQMDWSLNHWKGFVQTIVWYVDIAKTN